MSLDEAQQKKPEVIIIDSDDEQDPDGEDAVFQAQLQKAIEESKNIASSASTSTVVSQAPSGSSSGSGVTSFLSQRAQLERERLERQRKLQGNVNTKSQKPEDVDTDDEDERPAKRRHLATSSFAGTQEASSSKQTKPQDQNFWKGELRQTATRLAEPRADGQPTFRLTQVLGQVPQNFGTPIDGSLTFT